MSKQSNLKILLNGIIKENPVLVLILGTCPTLAVTSLAVNGLGTVSYTHLDVYKRQYLLAVDAFKKILA